MDLVINTTDTNFENDINDKNRLVLVDLWAEWCGPCLMIGPIIEEIAKENEKNIKVLRLNVDENQNTAIKFNVMNIPTLLVFKNGKEIDRIIGAQPKRNILSRINEHM